MHLPGDRPDVRDRSTTVAMHLVRRLLTTDFVGGAHEGDAGLPAGEATRRA